MGAVLESVCIVVTDQLGRGAGQHRCCFQQRHLLEIALLVVAGRLQPGLAELRRYVRGGDVVAARSGGATFQQIGGKKFNVTADGVRLCFDGVLYHWA